MSQKCCQQPTFKSDRNPRLSPSVFWLKPSYEAVGLPKLNGVTINDDFCEPSRLGVIRAADVDPINSVAKKEAG
jgi:hypothetical protein